MLNQNNSGPKANPIKLKLDSGQPVIGIWSIISSPIVVEIFALGGFDFAILDMEHGVFDVVALDNAIRACEGGGGAPLVRIPGINPWAAQWALDLGAYGIVVPQVNNPEEAKDVVRIAKYAPTGARGYNPFTRAANYANPADNLSGKLNNNFSLACIIIESPAALENISSICNVPDVDVIYIGIYDLAVAMGFNGDTNNAEVKKIAHLAISKIRNAGKAAGMIVGSAKDIEIALSLGANFLVYSVDTFIIRNKVNSIIEIFKNELILYNQNAK